MDDWLGLNDTEDSGDDWLGLNTPAPEPEPPAEDVGLLEEIGSSFGRGAGNLVSGVGALTGVVTGNMDNAISQYGDRMGEFYDNKSQALQTAEQERSAAIEAADGEWSKAGAWLTETFTDPRLVANMLAEQVPGFAIPGGAGAAGARVSQKVAGKLLERGMTKTAGILGKSGGTAAAVGTGAAMQSGDVTGGAYDDLMKLPEEEWRGSEEYLSMVTDGVDPQIAKDQIARKLAAKAGTGSFAISVATQFLPGGRTFEKVVGRGDRTGVSDKALNRFITGFAGEGLQESAEEIGGAIAGNLSVGAIDSNRGAFEGAGEAGAAGLAVGGPIGGGINVLAGPDKSLPDVTEDEIEKELREREAEVEANERAAALADEADAIAGAAAEEVAQQGGDELDQLEAAINAYNEVEPAQQLLEGEERQAEIERQLAATGQATLADTSVFDQPAVAPTEDQTIANTDGLFDEPAVAPEEPIAFTRPTQGPRADRPRTQSQPGTPDQEAVADARAFDGEEAAVRTEQAQRLRSMAQRAQQAGNTESAQRMLSRAADIEQDLQGIPVAEVTQETRQEFIPAEQVQGAAPAQEAPVTLEGTIVPNSGITDEGIIYGQEPEGTKQRRVEKQQADDIARTGIIEPGSTPRPAAALSPFQSSVPAEEITATEASPAEAADFDDAQLATAQQALADSEASFEEADNAWQDNPSDQNERAMLSARESRDRARVAEDRVKYVREKMRSGRSKEEAVAKYDEYVARIIESGNNGNQAATNSPVYRVYKASEQAAEPPEITDKDYPSPLENSEVFTVGEKASRGTLDVVADLEDNPEKVANERGLEMDVVSMSPAEYIKLASEERARAEQTTADYEIKKRREANADKIASIAKDIEAGVQFAAPSLDYSTGGFSQDGLHRAMAAESLGLTSIPVSVIREAANMEVRQDRNVLGGARQKKAEADAYKMLAGKTTSEVVQDEDGNEYELDKPLDKTVRQMNKRLSVMDQLLECLRG